MLRLSEDKKKFQFTQPKCHTRLNRFGEMSLSNRYDNIKNLRTQPSMSPKPLKKKQTINQGQSQKLNSSQTFNPQITKQYDNIRKLGLIGGLNLKQVKYEGHIKIPTVHNDYHSSGSNPGYSRKPDGGIYPK